MNWYQVWNNEKLRMILSREPKPGVRYVVGPDGSPLTIENLPKTLFSRWGSLDKAKIVAAVRGGLISLDDLSSRYSLAVEEYLSWKENSDLYSEQSTEAAKSIENGKK